MSDDAIVSIVGNAAADATVEIIAVGTVVGERRVDDRRLIKLITYKPPSSLVALLPLTVTLVSETSPSCCIKPPPLPFVAALFEIVLAVIVKSLTDLIPPPNGALLLSIVVVEIVIGPAL